MVAKASQTPGLTQVFSLFETSTPQLYLDIDRTKAQMLGVNVSDVFGALQTYLGSTYVNDFNLLGRTFRVTAQADAALPPRHQGRAKDPRAQQPRRYRAARLVHHRARHSGPTACPATTSIPPPSSTPPPLPGMSQGQVIEALQKLAAETLPEGIGYEWTTLAFQQHAGPATRRSSPSCWRWCSCSSCSRRSTRASPCRSPSS